MLLNTSRPISTRSRSVKSGCFSRFTRIATMMRSKMLAPRVMMSMWPFVNGSNDPGYTARRNLADELIERQRAVTRTHRPRSGQSSGRRRRRAPARMLENQEAFGLEKASEGFDRGLEIRLVIRGIGQNQVES